MSLTKSVPSGLWQYESWRSADAREGEGEEEQDGEGADGEREGASAHGGPPRATEGQVRQASMRW